MMTERFLAFKQKSTFTLSLLLGTKLYPDENIAYSIIIKFIGMIDWNNKTQSNGNH